MIRSEVDVVVLFVNTQVSRFGFQCKGVYVTDLGSIISHQVFIQKGQGGGNLFGLAFKNQRSGLELRTYWQIGITEDSGVQVGHRSDPSIVTRVEQAGGAFDFQSLKFFSFTFPPILQVVTSKISSCQIQLLQPRFLINQTVTFFLRCQITSSKVRRELPLRSRRSCHFLPLLLVLTCAIFIHSVFYCKQFSWFVISCSVT